MPTKTNFAIPQPRVVHLGKGKTAASNDVDKQTLREYVEEKLAEMIMSLIPESIKELPPKYVLRVGAMALIAMLCMFLYFVATGVQANLKSKFISLEVDSGNCEVVSKEITGQGPYEATSDGYWQGDNNFRYSNVQYLLTLNKFHEDLGEYTKMMNYFGTQLEKFAAISTHESVQYNAMLMMSWGASYKMGNHIQICRLSGDPSALFDTYIIAGSLAGGNDVCQANVWVDYDKSSGLFIVEFDYNNYYETCNSMYPIARLSTSYTLPYTLQVAFDSKSFITALAVNNGILRVDQLVKVPLSSEDTRIDGNTSFKMFDSKYPSMEPIICLNPKYNDGYNFCYMMVYKSYAIPSLNPRGLTFDYPTPCPKCGEPISDEGLEICNWLDSISGLILFRYQRDILDFYYKNREMVATQFNDVVFNVTFGAAFGYTYTEYVNETICDGDSAQTTAQRSRNLNSGVPKRPRKLQDYDDEEDDDVDNYENGSDRVRNIRAKLDRMRRGGPQQQHRVGQSRRSQRMSKYRDEGRQGGVEASRSSRSSPTAGIASSSSSRISVSGSNSSQCHNVTVPVEVTIFDDIPYMNFDFCDNKCSAIGIYTETLYGNFYISPYYFQMQHARCRNITYNAAIWESIATNPPVILTEPYYECTSTFFDALSNAIGIANGNTSTFFPIGVALLLPLMYLYLRMIDYVPERQDYTKEQKEEVVSIFSTNVLRSRDGKTRAMTRNGPIIKLTKDLIRVAQQPPGYPDSDDENSDSDDEIDEDEQGQDGNNGNDDDDDEDDEDDEDDKNSGNDIEKPPGKKAKGTRRSSKAKSRKVKVSSFEVDTSATQQKPPRKTSIVFQNNPINFLYKSSSQKSLNMNEGA